MLSRLLPSITRLALAALVPAAPLAADDTLLVPRRTTDPGFQYHPSPEDWRDINLYQIFTDRFHDGDPSNNLTRRMAYGWGWDGEQTEGKPWYNEFNRNDANARHLAQGGDWRGIRDKIPYLKSMGIRAVWISSVQRNEQGVDKRYTPYHSYHPTDLYRVEPLFGSFQDLKDLIDALHAADIYVILDVVPNHMADLLGLGDGRDNYFHPDGGGNLFWWNNNIRHAPPFDSPEHFHNNGKILNWDDSYQALRGAFVGTDDLRTENAYVQEELIRAFKNLIEATDCDGFRVDAIKHVEFDFIRHWAHEMRTHAASLGKSDFLLFGEYFSYNDEDHARFARDNGYSFNSVMWFSMMQTMRNVFEYEQGTDQLNRLGNLGYFGEAATRLVTFLDNHDVDRICLRKGDTWADTLRPAIGFLYTAAPIPTILYGTEHGFNQGGRENRGIEDGDYQRETMMDYGYQWGNAHGDKFTAPSEIKDLIGRLNAARARHPSLRRGDFRERWQSNNKGIFAFSRKYGTEESLVILNTDWNEQSASPAVDAADGTVFTNVLDPNESVTVQGGQLFLRVPRKGIKVFVTGAAASTVSISNTRHWPLNGEIEPDSDIWIDSETFPAGAAVSGEAIISTDGGISWSAFPLSRNGSVEGRDAWHVMIGQYPAGTTIQFAVNFIDAEGETVWDSQGGTNYRLAVNAGPPEEPAVTENTTTLRLAGEFHTGHDLVIFTESKPQGRQVGGAVVYSADGGTTWNVVALVPNGTTATHDRWVANLGSFAAGTTIRFAVMTRDALGAEAWDNNNGADYTLTATARPAPVPPPTVQLRAQDGGWVLDLGSLEAALPYTVERSADLHTWVAEETFTADSLTEVVVLAAASSPDLDRQFYRLRHGRTGEDAPLTFEVPTLASLPAGAEVVVSVYTSPTGAVAAADLVYSFADGDWSAQPMTRTAGDPTDTWTANLGVLGNGTLRYAIAFTPATGGATLWANNDGQDYFLTVGPD